MAPFECKKILIANRGEIACRIARTCRAMGIPTVAIFSDADRFSPHCSLADEAQWIGPAESGESYLSIDAIIGACKKTGADAVHPGYGFLSENPAFVERLDHAGITFIGPSAASMRLVGDKIQAKNLARSLSVPLIPDAECQIKSKEDRESLSALLKKIGYPVVIKAAAGGGGRGMRVVRSEAELDTLLASAIREAEASFGDGRVFIEKYVSPARHIEIQFFGDRHGNAITLAERDCTLQRRHQKVIEEAPAVDLPDALRRGLHSAARSLALESKYVGAGTAEFLVTPSGEYYFLEVNSRLQVEHPVTEMITGIDLVQLQIETARGKKLSELVPHDLSPRGHSIEVRLCAEVPEEGFRAATGRIGCVSFGTQAGVRIDSWIEEHSVVSHYYDSLLAKIVVWAPQRAEAVTKLSSVLKETVIGGVQTNLSYLFHLLSSPQFQSRTHDLQTAEQVLREMRPVADSCIHGILAAYAIQSAGCAGSAWGNRSQTSTQVVVGASGATWVVRLGRQASSSQTFCTISQGASVKGTGELEIIHMTENQWIFTWNKERLEVSVAQRGSRTWVSSHGSTLLMMPGVLTLRESESKESSHGGLITSPLPGKVVDIKVEIGASVVTGIPLLILESMKMEHVVSAPRDGIVANLSVKKGDVVDAGKVLLEVR